METVSVFRVPTHSGKLREMAFPWKIREISGNLPSSSGNFRNQKNIREFSGKKMGQRVGTLVVLAINEGNSPVTGEFPSQRPVTQSFDVFFDLRLNKRLSKQSRSQWFETPSGPLWRHCNEKKNTVLRRHSSYACNSYLLWDILNSLKWRIYAPVN